MSEEERERYIDKDREIERHWKRTSINRETEKQIISENDDNPNQVWHKNDISFRINIENFE